MGVSLRSLLIVPFVLQVVGITSLVGYLSYRSGQASVEDLAHQLMDQTANRVRDRLKDHLGMAHLTLARNKQALEGGRVDAGDLETLEHYFFDILTLNDSFVTLGYGSATGESILVALDETQAVTPVKGYIVAETPAPRSQENHSYLLDDQGQRGDPIGTVPNYDPRQIIWYQTAVEQQGPAWTPIYPLVLAPIASTLAVTPVYQNTGDLQGVLFATVPMTRVSEFLGKLNFSPQGQVFVMERSGDLVATSTLEKAFTVSGPPDDRHMVRVNARHSQDPVTQAATVALFEQFDSLEGLTYVQFEFVQPVSSGEGTGDGTKQRYFTTVTPYQDDRGLDWLIVTVIPQSDFIGTIQANAHRTALLCGVALVGSLGFGIWASRRVTHSLQMLNRATRAYGAGRPLPPLRPSRIREVDTLRQTFEQMMADLEQQTRQIAELHARYTRSLEQTVADRTAALQATTAQLEAAQRIAQVGSWELDVATGQSIWSQELFRILGRDPHQPALPCPDIFDIIPPADRNDLRLAVEAAIADGTPYEVEHRITRPDGTVRYLVSRGEAITDDQGNVVKLFGTAADMTDRKQAELALKESERRFQDISDASPANIYVLVRRVDGSFYFEHMSRAIETIQEIPVEQILADADVLLNCIHPDDRPAYEAAAQHSLATQALFQHEWRIITPSGQVKWLQGRSRPRHRANEDIAWYGVVIDITDRKRAETRLRQHQQQLDGILKSIESAVWSVTYPELQTLYVSPGAEIIYQRPVAEFTANPQLWLEVVHPDDHPRVLATLPQLLEEGQMVSEKRIVRPNGQVRWVLDRCWLVYDEAGVPNRVDGIAVDITDRKLAEAQLQTEVEFRRAIEAAIVEGIAMVDMAGQQMYVNPAFCAMVGWPAEDLIGATPPFAYWPPEEVDTITETLQRCLAGDRPPQGVELRFMRRNGERFDVLILDAPLRNAQGEITAWLASVYDITERKRVQRALAASEAKFSTIFHSNPAPAWIATLAEGRTLDVNPSFSQFYGVPVADLIGKTCRSIDLWHQEAEAQIFFDQLNTTGHLENLEVTFRTVAGNLRTVLISATVRPINGQDCVIGVLSDISDRKQAALALQAKTEELDQFFSVALDLLCIADLDGYFRRLNRQWERTLGYSLSELEGAKFLDFVHPEDRESTLAALAALKDKQEIFNFTNRYRCQNGTYRWIEWRAVSVGHLVYGAARDITDRQEAELALKNLSQELASWQDRYDVATWAGRQIIYEYSLVEDRYTWGRNTEEILGYGRAEMPQTLEAGIGMIHPDDQPSFITLLHHREAATDPFQLEFRVRKQDGTYLWMEDRGVVQLDPQGTPIKIVGALKDISDRKQAELALQESESMLRQITENLPLFFGVRPLDKGHWLYINPAFASITGYPVQLMYEDAQFWQKLVDPEDWPQLAKAEISSTNLVPLDQTFRILRADGQRVWIRMVEFPVYNQQGDPCRVVAFGEDVTEQKQAEEELQRLNAQLQELATTDSLTQVANRRRFLATFRQEWQRHQREHLPLAVIMVDIDHFKAYNDRYGHPAGDACLVQVAQILQQCIQRPNDLVARYGGEEFVILLSNTDTRGAVAIARRIQGAIATLAIPHDDSPTDASITLSLGIATIIMPTLTNPQTVISKADAALYRAKQLRNTYCVEEMQG